MPDVSTIEVKLNGTAPAIVIDGDLALSRWGLMISAHLAQSAPLWLPRSIWPLIDSDSLYQREPDLLGDDGGEVAEILSQWQMMWQTNRLKGQYCWFGDLRHEGQITKDMDDFVHQRFEAALTMLVGRVEDHQPSSDMDWRTQAIWDAFATAAALSPQTAILIARRSQLPRITAVVDALPEASIDEIPVSPSAPGEKPLLGGLPPVMLGVLDLVAVHIAAPGAMLLPWGVGEASLWGDSDPGLPGPIGFAPDPWTGAVVAWRRLTP
jgi:hypothetical protein